MSYEYNYKSDGFAFNKTIDLANELFAPSSFWQNRRL